MNKTGYTRELKLEICKKFVDSNISYRELQEEYGVHPTTMVRWTKLYREHGESAFEAGTVTNKGSEYRSTKKRVDDLEEEVSNLKTQLEEIKAQVKELDEEIFEEIEENSEEGEEECVTEII
jgi:transposase-like protein